MSPFTKQVLKIGAVATAGAATGAYVGGALAAPPGQRHEGGIQGAKIAVGVGATLTAGLAGRRYVAAAAKGASGAVSDLVFRRVRGRIVPIHRVKV